MKKKRIIIASILGATSLIAGTAATTILITDSFNNKIREKEIESLDESVVAEDDIFGNGIMSLIADKPVKRTENNTQSQLVKPMIGRQYYINDGKISIRFFAAISELDVNAVWTRTLYNEDGSVNNALSTSTKTSTVAYTSLSYYDYTNGENAILNATNVKAEDGTNPYKYFVIYTIKNIPISDYENCSIDANLEVSNDNGVIASKTGSVKTNTTAAMSSYSLDLDFDNTYQGSNTTVGNQQYINGKVKTIYSTDDTSLDLSNIDGTIYKDGVAQAKKTTKTTLSFKDDTKNESADYLVYADQSIDTNGLNIGMFTILDNGKGVVVNNGDWLKFNTGGKVIFDVESSATLSISFYQDNNNVKVTVNGNEVECGSNGSYTIPAGSVVIEAISNGYLGKIIVEEKDMPTFSGFKPGVAGKQTITARYNNASTTYDIYVLDADCAYKDSNNNYVVTVDQSYTGLIGAIDGDNGNMFTTISQALEFLQNTSFVQKGANKILNIGAGYYKEKLEITTPNLTINGSGTLAKGTYSSDENYNAANFAAATIIEYDTLYGVTDTNGFTHTTDSTQTVAIRETATNCKINGVTISNAYNCKEYFDAKGVSNEHRALALLVQSDQFQMSNSALLGYQDTLELMTGRQYFKSCYISGTTDFIFGTNNITLFDSCDIHTIYNGSTDGGYITAFKGINNSKAPTYGVTFYKCNFTKDSDVYTGNDLVEYGNTSLARPWDSYSNVAFIECEMDAHISKLGYVSNSTKNNRYVAWTNQGAVTSEPGVGNVKYVEYGNTGAGAVTSAVDGMTMLTKEQAANYHDFSVIFAATNGNISFDAAWNPEVIVVDNSVHYFFNNGTADSGTSYNITEYSASKGTNPTTIDGLTLDPTNGNIAVNSDAASINMKTNAKITFSVSAGTTITIKAHSANYAQFLVNGLGTTTDTFTNYYATDTDIEIVSTGDAYIKSISINPNGSEISRTLSSIELIGAPANEYTTGTNYDLSSLKVKVIYSDSTFIYSTNFTTDAATVVDKNVAGVYEITVTYAEDLIVKTKKFNITYVEPSSDNSISKTTGLDFSSNTNTATALANSKVDYTNASISANGNNASFQSGYITFDVKAGAIITVGTYKTYGNYKIGTTSNAEANLINYTSTTSYTATSDCTIKIYGYSNNYLSFIGISYPISTATTYTFLTTVNSGEVDVCSTTAIQNVDAFKSGLIIGAKNGKVGPNNSSWGQFNAGTTLTFTVAANANVQINCYTSDFTVNETAASAATVTLNPTETTTYVIAATANTYISKIIITF